MYGTDIHSTIMKESPKITPRPVKVNTVDAEIYNMLLDKELYEWL